MTFDEIIKDLKKNSNPKTREGMKRFGVNGDTALGVTIPVLRNFAKSIKTDHALALQLWDSNIHEARILAAIIADPKQTTEKLMEKWMKDFNSWDVCDQCCGNLFDKTPIAFNKALEWSKRKAEFQKRAGFVMMAALAVHDKKSEDEKFLQFFPLIEKEAYDDRNFVKKAVNWALRQIGKRNNFLNKEAIEVAERILQQESKSAKWIASDALRELKSEKIKARIKNKK